VRSGQLVAVDVALTLVSPVLAQPVRLRATRSQAQNGGLYARDTDDRIKPWYEQSRRLSHGAQTNRRSFVGWTNISRCRAYPALRKYRLHTLRHLSCSSC